MENIKQWLNEALQAEHIRQNPDGSEYIDISKVEDELDILDTHWGAENFKYKVETLEGRLFGSASLELIVSYDGKQRRIVGAATVELIDHIHSEPTLVSECIKNAAKKLGRRFGKYLNDRGGQQGPIIEKPKRAKREAVLMKPSSYSVEMYQQALIAGNKEKIAALEAVYDFSQTPNPENA